MLMRVITLRFDPVTSSFDDGPVRDFIKDKEVLAIRDHFFMKNEVPNCRADNLPSPARRDTAPRFS